MNPPNDDALPQHLKQLRRLRDDLLALSALRRRASHDNDTIGGLFAPLLGVPIVTWEQLDKEQRALEVWMKQEFPGFHLGYSHVLQSYVLVPIRGPDVGIEPDTK